MLLVEDTAIPGIKIITPMKHGDARGFFSEVYKQSEWRVRGVDVEFVQENHSYSQPAGTLRGLHFQIAPSAQAKLIRVVRGSVLDVAVDIRRSSPTFGSHVAIELSAGNWRQLFVPVGFAHGFVTLEADTEVLYKVSALYTPEHERGLAWNDPDLKIDWPLTEHQLLLSSRDGNWPRLRDLPEAFP